MKKIAVVIVTWNKKDKVLRCLNSVYQSKNTSPEIFVVDNASEDGTSEAITAQYPQVHLIRHEQNLGGSGGFASGLTKALTHEDIGYFHLLDNDVVLDFNATQALVNAIDEFGFGACGSLILRMNQPEITQEMGGKLDWSTGMFSLVQAGIKRNGVLKVCEVDYVPACSMMLTRECIAKTGLIDQSFFLYWDDIDWGLRIKRNGYMVGAVASSVVWHEGGGRTKTSANPTYYFWRNRLRVILSHCPEDKIEKAVRSYSCDWKKALLMSKYYQDASTEQALKMAIDHGLCKKWSKYEANLGSPKNKHSDTEQSHGYVVDCEHVLDTITKFDTTQETYLKDKWGHILKVDQHLLELQNMYQTWLNSSLEDMVLRIKSAW